MSIPTTELEIIHRLKELMKVHQTMVAGLDVLANDLRYNKSDRGVANEFSKMSTFTVTDLKEIVTGLGIIAMHQSSVDVEKVVKALAE